MRRNEQLAALDGLIASKARKVERAAHELRALIRQRMELASEPTSQEDTDGTATEQEDTRHHAHASA